MYLFFHFFQKILNFSSGDNTIRSQGPTARRETKKSKFEAKTQISPRNISQKSYIFPQITQFKP